MNDKKMNIAIVSYVCARNSGSRAPVEIARALAKRGHQIYFFALDYLTDPETFTDLKAASIKVQLIKKKGIPYFSLIFAATQLFHNLRKGKHEIILLHTIPEFVIAARLTGIPSISSYYGTQFNAISEHVSKTLFVIIADKILNAIIFIRSWIIVRLPNRCISISDYAKHEAHTLFGVKTKTIYLGSNPNTLNTQTSSKQSTELRLLSISRLTPYKNFTLLINIVRELIRQKKPITLTIAGTPIVPAYKEKLATLTNKHIHLILTPSDNRLASLYKKSDVYITADRYLFFGLPILEAAWFGIPSIVFDFGAAHELVQHGKTGYVVKNSQEMKKYIMKLADDSRLCKKLGSNAQVFAKKFTWDICGRRWENVCRKMLKQNQ
ncbi:glycosyltransferase [Candidatus Microgenomates bacterium]|nr:MAG: glycosyltransferase [Candidatus Microgenomates bacterium]